MRYLALAATGAAVLGLTACSQAAAPSAAPASPRTSPAIAPVNCSQQYHAWNHGQGKGLIAALTAVSSADRAGDAHVLTVALKKARPAVARAARHPVPACADPRGYWSVLLMHVNAAAAGPGSASSVRAAMTDVPKIERNLMAELNGASG
jgi:hypothetical protein